MNQELLQQLIDQWEPEIAEVVRVIDTTEGTVERIVKVWDRYSLYRYFEMPTRYEGNEASTPIVVSVDLSGVDADTIIQHLAERL